MIKENLYVFVLQHEELVLLLIQLRRSQSRLQDVKNWYRGQMDVSRDYEKEYKKKQVIIPILLYCKANSYYVCMYLPKPGTNFFWGGGVGEVSSK